VEGVEIIRIKRKREEKGDIITMAASYEGIF